MSGTGGRPVVPRREIPAAERGSRPAAILLAAYLVLTALVVLEPSNSLGPLAVWSVSALLQAAGLPWWLVGFDTVQVVLNVVLLAPVTLLGRLALPRLRTWTWLACAAAGSVAVELVQAVALPARTASPLDVLANVAGAGVGLALAAVLRRW